MTIKRETCPNFLATHGRCQHNSEQNTVYKKKKKKNQSKFVVKIYSQYYKHYLSDISQLFIANIATGSSLLCHILSYDISHLDFQVHEQSCYPCFTSERSVTADTCLSVSQQSSSRTWKLFYISRYSEMPHLI